MHIIDSHLHINMSGYTINNLIKYMDTHHIDQCWLMTWDELYPIIPQIYENLSIEDVFHAYKKYPDRIIPFYAPDPHRPNWLSRFQYYQAKGVKGFGELKISEKWNSSVIEQMLNKIEYARVPLLFHMEDRHYQYLPETMFDKFIKRLVNIIPRVTMDKMATLFPSIQKGQSGKLKYFPGYLLDFAELESQLIKHPDLIFIAHGPHFWNHIADKYNPDQFHNKGKVKKEGIICGLLKKYNNLYADLSGVSGFNAINRDHTFAKTFLEKYYNKILYGTDNYELGLAEFINSLSLPKEKLQYIFRINAQNILDKEKS